MEENKKKVYVVPEIEIFSIESDEILTTSGPTLKDVFDPANEDNDGMSW